MQLLTSGQTGLQDLGADKVSCREVLYPGGEHFDFLAYSPYSIDIARRARPRRHEGPLRRPWETCGAYHSGGQAAALAGKRNRSLDGAVGRPEPRPGRNLRDRLRRLRIYDALVGISNYDSGAVGTMSDVRWQASALSRDTSIRPGTRSSGQTLAPSPSDTGWLIVKTTCIPSREPPMKSATV